MLRNEVVEVLNDGSTKRTEELGVRELANFALELGANDLSFNVHQQLEGH